MAVQPSIVDEFYAKVIPDLTLPPERINSSEIALYETAIAAGEGRLAATGALAVETGQHTGRSARDKFIVRDAVTDPVIWWDNNQSMTPEHFECLYADVLTHAQNKDLFQQDLFAGADPAYRLPVRVFTEYAWHALFIRYLLRTPETRELPSFSPEFTIICLPSFKADPARHGVRSDTVIACDFRRHLVLIGGTSYAGEIKKSVFSFLNFVLPEQDVMPMHCSANEGAEGSAAFFGLSGTGKTTLSADPGRVLLGDDEHGWSENGLFNFEGGCYAKTINLSEDAEPQIYAATNRFCALLENVVIDPENRQPDFEDGSLTENARSAYPMHFIPNASRTGRAGHPKSIIMLTADAFGVLPPIAKLTASQAIYHFLSGYTAKVAGTEKGVSGVQATFSTCFGAPFMPRHPSVYGSLLQRFIAKHDVNCWLVNTGWTGGPYGEGRRMPIVATRALLSAALDGTLNSADMRTDPIFGLSVPVAVEGMDPKILNPRETWADPAVYYSQANALVDMFVENFHKFAAHVEPDVLEAGPRRAAATS